MAYWRLSNSDDTYFRQ